MYKIAKCTKCHHEWQMVIKPGKCAWCGAVGKELKPENWRKRWIKQGYNPSNCTCLKCVVEKTCEYSHDEYNTDGDCLKEK